MLSRAIAIVVVLSVFMPAVAQDRLDLHWRWMEGRTLTYRVAEEMEQAIVGGEGTDLKWVRTIRLELVSGG